MKKLLSGSALLLISVITVAELGTATAQPQTVAYVTNNGSNSVSVIDIVTNTVIATIPVGVNPAGVAISPDGTRAYVANSSFLHNTVSVIDIVTNTVIATIPVGQVPAGIAVAPDGGRTYVTNVYPNTVSIIDTATNTLVSTIPVGINPIGVAVTSDGTRAYVANFVSTLSRSSTPRPTP
jgi:YVTN family beta-propeller protein